MNTFPSAEERAAAAEVRGLLLTIGKHQDERFEIRSIPGSGFHVEAYVLAGPAHVAGWVWQQVHSSSKGGVDCHRPGRWIEYLKPLLDAKLAERARLEAEQAAEEQRRAEAWYVANWSPIDDAAIFGESGKAGKAVQG